MNKEKEDKSICRALITASVDESYDFECIAVPSDNKQLKYSWDNNEYFYQVLRTNKENIDASRLDSGLPLFDNHPEMEDAGALNQLGITLTYDFLTEGLAVRCKFGARADQALKDDVKNQIVKTVSIEGCVQNYTNPTDTILDCFGGSMSHAIAAHMERRKLTIIELDADYFKSALKRFDMYERQQVLF